MISVCTAVYREHGPPNAAGLADAFATALQGQDGELVVALNGVKATGVPDDVLRVDMGANRGVAPAWNAAARVAAGDVLVFCNDDVELGTRSLAQLADALRRHPEATVVGPVGSHWDIGQGKHLSWVRPTETSSDGMLACEVVSGFLFACRKAAWEEVGGFDEFYAPASWEEVDFCTAVRAAGGHCYAIAGVSCRHEWGVSRRQPPWARAHWNGRSEAWRSIHRRNRRHFLEKWGRHPIAEASANRVVAE
jgi:GT2 family glycosyltransferase